MDANSNLNEQMRKPRANNFGLRRAKSYCLINVEPQENKQIENYGTINANPEDYCNNNSGEVEVHTPRRSQVKDSGRTNNNKMKPPGPRRTTSMKEKEKEAGQNNENVRTRKKSIVQGVKTLVESEELYPPLLPSKTRKRSTELDEENVYRSRERDGESPCRQYLGLILTLLSSVFSSLSALTVKLLEDDYDPFVICFWRFCTMFVTAVGVLLFIRVQATTTIWHRPRSGERYGHTKNFLLLAVRGLLGCTGRIFYVYSITCMNLGDSMVIASSTPVFMTLFAYFLIGEKCGIIPVLVSIGTLVGVGVISRPPFITGQESYDHELLIGTETGMAGMVMTTLVMIAMRKLRNIHHALSTLSLALFGMILTFGLMQYYNIFEVPTKFAHISLILASGLTSFLGQTFLALGLKYENAGPVALMKNFDVVFAFLWSFLFLGVSPDFYSLGGGCIVIFCIIVSTVRKWLEGLPEENNVRRNFRFILK